MKVQKRTIGLIVYFIFLLLPIYWMLNMSFRTNADILSTFAFYPKNLTFENYIKIFTDSSWYSGYINSIIYVTINTVISLSVALPAAYAFSRYRFIGDGQMFFWLLTNRMAPAAVFALPFFQLYSTQENIKQKNAVTPTPERIKGIKIVIKNFGKEYPSIYAVSSISLGIPDIKPSKIHTAKGTLKRQ